MVSDKITSIYCLILENLGQNVILFYKTSPPGYQEAAYIRDMYLYKKLSVQVEFWYTGGGGGLRCSKDKKIKGCQLTTYEIRYRQREITLIVHFLIKA